MYFGLVCVSLIAISCKNNNNANKTNNDNSTINKKSNPCKFLPVDKSSKDPSLKQFLKELNNICETNNWDELILKLDNEVVNNYSSAPIIEGDAIAEFKRLWKYKKRDKTIFAMIKKTIQYGGDFLNNDTTYFAPAFEATGNCDSDYEGPEGNCLKSEVIVYKNKSTSSQKVGLLKYEGVKIDFEKSDIKDKKINESYSISDDNSWYYISTYDDSIAGYVQCKDIFFDTCNYTIQFIKHNDKWLISEFTLGE